MRAFAVTVSRLKITMVQLKIQTNFVKIKFEIAAPSMSDCLENGNLINNGLAMKGAIKSVSLYIVHYQLVTTIYANVSVYLFILKRLIIYVQTNLDFVKHKKERKEKKFAKFAGN